MTDQPILNEALLSPPTLGDEFAGLVAEVSDATIVGLDPLEVGRMLLVRHPADWTVSQFDTHQMAERPMWPALVTQHASVASFCSYVTRHKGAATTVWLASGTVHLGATVAIAEAILDDLSPDDELVARRAHRARLLLQPTEAAVRWAKALDGRVMSQADFVDLAIDGIAEIASPAGADLRDVVRDLQATRTSAARSVVPTGGSYRVEFSENVDLVAGPGANLALPDRIEIIVKPWRGLDHAIQLTVRVRPNVNDSGRVTFTLSCAQVADEMADSARRVGALIGEATSIEPYETPSIS